MTTIDVKTHDDKVFTVLLEHAKYCRTIKDMLEDLSHSGTELENNVVSLPDTVSSKNFCKIMEWYKFAVPSPSPEEPSTCILMKKKFELTTQQEEYIADMTPLDLLDLLGAVNFLAVSDLLEFLNNVIAYKVVLGKTPIEIAIMFGIDQAKVSDEAIAHALASDPDLAFLKDDK